MKFQVPKGVKEYLPPESAKFELVRENLISPARLANYQLMETAVFEDTGLFTSGVGESTDVVSKEMYTFTDRADRSLTLRPEGTAGVMRAVIESGLDRGQLPVKVWYSGAFFRAERPQAGRYRQFYQVGVEAIGGDDPLIDVEVVSLAVQAFNNLGLHDYEVQINSLGDKPSRDSHREALVKFLKEIDLDEVTRERAKINPLRVLDDKRPEMIAALKNAPVILDYLTQEAKERYSAVKNGLTNLGIKYIENPKLVRGLDYYTHTTFEFVHHKLGAQSGIGGGGRYDGLMEKLGGQSLSGIGYGIGVDRVLLACEAEGIELPPATQLSLYLVPLGEEARTFAIELLSNLRNNGIRCDMAYGERGLKGAMKSGDKSGAKYLAVLGENEISSGQAEIKRMSDGVVTSVRLTELADFLK
ncbi:MAG: histidine--tRNA ligase [Actinobacteria bacterium]|nr:histidine--tRNA ligase [Actinomycetota bacterium]